MPQGHDDLAWTWTAPGGEVFKGSADYIDGCRAGWEARSWSVPAAPTPEERGIRNIALSTAWQQGHDAAVRERPRCKFSSTCEHAHPDDIATHKDGGIW